MCLRYGKIKLYLDNKKDKYLTLIIIESRSNTCFGHTHISWQEHAMFSQIYNSIVHGKSPNAHYSYTRLRILS